MWPPPLLSERPRSHQIASAIGGPVILGAIAGILAGASSGAYLAVSIIAFFGGILAGYEHVGAAAGAKRGVLGGVLFGASILIVHAIIGGDLEASLPHPGIVLVLATVIFGAILGALGGVLRARSAKSGAGA